MRLVYRGVPFPRHAPLQCTPLLLACWNFCAACGLAARGLCGARSVCMLIVLQLDCGVLPPVGTTHFSRFGLTRTDTTYIAGVDRRQSSVFRCVVGRPLRLLCTSCPVQLSTRHFFRLAYCREWLAHCMPGLFGCRLDPRITAFCGRSHNHALQGVSVLLRVQSLVAVG